MGLAGGRDRIDRQNFARAVDGQIAQVLDELGLGENRVPSGGSKAGFVNQRAQVVLVGQAQGLVVLVEPGNCQLQRAPCIEAGSTRIRVRHSLCLDGRAIEGGPFGLEEGEVAHGLISAAICVRRSGKSA